MTSVALQIARRGTAHWKWAACATLFASALGLAAPAPSLGLQAILVGVPIALLGFPHGALDPLVARVSGARGSLGAIARFSLAYLAAAGAVLALWALAPAAGLALFLATSAIHFGLGDVASGSPRRALRVLAHGSAPIVLPAALHPGDVGTVFGWLLGADGGAVTAALESLRAPLVALWLAFAIASYAGRLREDRRGVTELVVLGLAFVTLPPLLSFAVYFCVWHSVRHLIAVDAVLGDDLRSRALVVGLAVLAATALLLAAGHAASASGDAIESATRTVFVGLAALTPPHMAVTYAMERRAISRCWE
ncbi:MAG: Brp/Blh family beta-carotene 15,15'-dioxygenase [Planctomycetota bacterium]